MSVPELAWRVSGKLRQVSDGITLPLRARPQSLEQFAKTSDPRAITCPSALGHHLRSCPFDKDKHEDWVKELRASADRLVEGRLQLFDMDAVETGSDINWNYEYKAGKEAPLIRASRIDYRDYQSVGDCKFVWEPNRHQHWVVLARAYRVTCDEKYAETVARQFDSWIRQCPFGRGMNWRSPLELGIRLINWCWTFALLDDASMMTRERRTVQAWSVRQHLAEITRNFSRYSSANNHLVGEAAGVFIAAHYFRGIKGCDAWIRASRAILEREIQLQTFSDGGTREQATGYHLFSLEFFLLAALVARNVGEELSDAYWTRLEAMFEFVAGMCEGGTYPMIGDADDGYVLNLGDRERPAESWVELGAVLFGRERIKPKTDTLTESCYWLFGSDRANETSKVEGPTSKVDCSRISDRRPLSSRAFPDTGYYLLQYGLESSDDSISVIVDGGPLGFLSIAAHGHADAASLLLRVNGQDVLVDPGTYDYFTFPAWREYFRSTRAHNTLMVDSQSQSEMQGPFMWGRRAECRCLEWQPSDTGGKLTVEHDGYARLEDPVVHRRHVELDGEKRNLTVTDEVDMRGCHDLAFHWHFAEQCRIVEQDENQVRVDFGGGQVTFVFDARLDLSVSQGELDPITGWVSRGYHRRQPSLTLSARCSVSGPTTLRTVMDIDASTATSDAEGSLGTGTVGAKGLGSAV